MMEKPPTLPPLNILFKWRNTLALSSRNRGKVAPDPVEGRQLDKSGHSGSSACSLKQRLNGPEEGLFFVNPALSVHEILSIAAEVINERGRTEPPIGIFLDS